MPEATIFINITSFAHECIRLRSDWAWEADCVKCRNGSWFIKVSSQDIYRLQCHRLEEETFSDTIVRLMSQMPLRKNGS